jgi:DNA-binding NtrC family response regulator
MDKKPHLLIVEEEEGVRQLLRLAMERYGFTVSTAASGQEGIDYYRQHGPAVDVVLLDVRMKGLDGPQTFCQLQKLNPKVRACFMTGDTAASRGPELMAMGALEVFHKPFNSLAALAQRLRDHVQAQ